MKVWHFVEWLWLTFNFLIQTFSEKKRLNNDKIKQKVYLLLKWPSSIFYNDISVGTISGDNYLIFAIVNCMCSENKLGQFFTFHNYNRSLCMLFIQVYYKQWAVYAEIEINIMFYNNRSHIFSHVKLLYIFLHHIAFVFVSSGGNQPDRAND